MHYKNFLVALAIVAVVFVGVKAVPASALTADDVQTQIQRLMAQISELTAQITRLRGQAGNMDSSVGAALMPSFQHRICNILNRNLAAGAEGDDVRGLQEYLYENKFLSVAPTGYFGQMTQEAVRKWQTQEGVQAVGAFGPLSRERIKKWCGGGFVNKERFSASPTRGDAPLAVTFYSYVSGFRPQSDYYTVEFGDGTSERASHCMAPTDFCSDPGTNTHTYSSNGTYTATLIHTSDPCDGNPMCKAPISREVVGKVQIIVGPIACTKEYKPVCGSKPIVCITTPCNPIPTTYGNRCEMAADSASFLYEGQCRTGYTNPSDDPQCKRWSDGRVCGGTYCSRSAPGGTPQCVASMCSGQVVESGATWRCLEYFNSPSNKPPVISGFSGPTTLAEDATGTWTVNARDPEGGSLSYQVWWGDENVYAPNLTTASAAREFTQSTTFTHAYADSGTYTVQITVRDSSGAEAKTTSTVYVSGVTACTMEYAPVCGRKPGCVPCNAPQGTACPMVCQLYPLQTYSNRCMLSAAGANYSFEGQCPDTTN